MNDTPPDNDYHLAVSTEYRVGNLETIDLSRHEYIALKAHLAAIRGYASGGNLEERLSQVSSEIEAASHIITPGLDHVVNGLQISREMFERCPDLVMLISDTFVEDLVAIHARAITSIPGRPI